MFIAMIVLHITDIEHGILRKIVYIRVLNSHLIIYCTVCRGIIESVDSICRDGADTPI